MTDTPTPERGEPTVPCSVCGIYDEHVTQYGGVSGLHRKHNQCIDALRAECARLETKARAAWMEHMFCGDQAPVCQEGIDMAREHGEREGIDLDEWQAELDAHTKAFAEAYDTWSGQYDTQSNPGAPRDGE